MRADRTFLTFGRWCDYLNAVLERRGEPAVSDADAQHLHQLGKSPVEAAALLQSERQQHALEVFVVAVTLEDGRTGNTLIRAASEADALASARGRYGTLGHVVAQARVVSRRAGPGGAA